MTKADIINEVAIATGMPKKEVGTVVEAFMEEVKKCLIEKKDNVYLLRYSASVSPSWLSWPSSRGKSPLRSVMPVSKTV